MATFAPDLPNMNTPDWTKVTKPIEQPEADKSKGIALSTIGTGIAEGATLAENTFESYVKDKIRSGVDALRDTTTTAYENIRNAQVTGGKPDPRAVQTAGFDGSLLNQNTDIPQGLQTGLDRAGNLALAQAQGKANDTLYTGALNAMAKQLRAQYPGHADYIDEQISKISGINPANAYMQNLLTDINRNSLKEDVFHKQVMDMAKSYFGDPSVFKYWQAYQHGLPGSFENLTSAVQRATSRDYQNQQKKTDRDNSHADQVDAADLASRDQVQHVLQRAQENFDPIVTIPGLTTPKRISQIVQDQQEGRAPPLTGPQWDQLSQAVQASRRHFEEQMVQDQQRYGYAKTINNPDTLKKNRQVGLDLWDGLQDAISNKDIGAMYSIKRQNDLAVSDSRNQAYSSPIGTWMKDRKVLAEDLGPNWMNTVDNITLTKGSKLKDLETFYGDATRAAGASPDLRRSDNIKSLTDSLHATKEAKDNGRDVPERAYKDLADNVDLILKAQEQGNQKVAKNVVDYMFGPRNAKLMDFWGNDFKDDKGYHLGKEGIAHQLNRPELTDAIWNLRDRNSWDMYKNSQETWFKTNFQSNVQQLSQAVQSKIFPGQVSWDSDNHQIKVIPTDPNKSIRGIQDIVAKINGGLHDMAYMNDKEGTDTNEHMWDLLMNMGYSPNDRLHGDNLPQRVIQAIQSSTKTNKQRLEEAFKASKGNQ
jgi:hypothetical protein